MTDNALAKKEKNKMISNGQQNTCQKSKDCVLETTKQVLYHAGIFPLKITFVFFQWKSKIKNSHNNSGN